MPAQLAASDAIAKLPPDQQQKQIADDHGLLEDLREVLLALHPAVDPARSASSKRVIMLIANAATRGDGTFKKFYALSITVAVVGTGLGSLVLGVIVLLRGANSFETTSAVQRALPSLALLAPGRERRAGRVPGRAQRLLSLGDGAARAGHEPRRPHPARRRHGRPPSSCCC